MPKIQYCPVCAATLTPRQLPTEDRERLVCSNNTCNYIHYDNPTPVLAAIVEYEGKILLARNTLWPPQWFGLITGFLEKNEHPTEGILREVKEETNLDGKVIELVGLYTFFRMNQLIIAYHVEATGEIILNEELAEYKLVEPQKARPWGSGTGDALKDWLAKRGIFNEPIQLG
ncbi:MAG: NUDIX domain-containing protein [Cytophagales bacterium]|nr:MAG: NUDIX domain-containing protein [Cytophagales bacterium]